VPKHLKIALILGSFLIAGAAWLRLPAESLRQIGPHIQATSPKGSSPRDGHSEGPNERQAWEMSRLADPKTGQIPTDIHRRERVFAAALPQWQDG